MTGEKDSTLRNYCAVLKQHKNLLSNIGGEGEEVISIICLTFAPSAIRNIVVDFNKISSGLSNRLIQYVTYGIS